MAIGMGRGMGRRMGVGVSLRPCCSHPGLPRASPIAGSSPAYKATSCRRVLASAGRRSRGQVPSTACASSRFRTPAGGILPRPPTPPSPLSALRNSGREMEAASWLPPAPLLVVTELETKLCMRHPLRVRSMPGTGKAPPRAPPHAPPPSKEQGRHLASAAGWRMGGILPGGPPSPASPGAQAHPAAPPGAGV